LIANNPADTQKQVPVTTPRFILAPPDQAQGSGGNHQGQALASHILRAYWQKRAAEVALSDSGNRRNILTLRVPFVERRPVDEFGHLVTWQ